MLETLDIPIWIWMNRQFSEIFTRPNWKYALNVLFRELSHAWTDPGTGWKVWYRCEQRRLGSACTLLAPFCSGFYQEQSLPQGADHNFREFWLQKMWISTPRRSLPATSPQPPKNSDSSSSKETDHLDWWEIETLRYPTLISETCHFLLPTSMHSSCPHSLRPLSTLLSGLALGAFIVLVLVGVKVCFARFQRWLSPNWSDATNGLFATRP